MKYKNIIAESEHFNTQFRTIESELWEYNTEFVLQELFFSSYCFKASDTSPHYDPPLPLSKPSATLLKS